MKVNMMTAPKENGTLILEYIRDSKKIMGLSLWNVRSPKLPGYSYGGVNGLPTFSIEGLKERGLLKWF